MTRAAGNKEGNGNSGKSNGDGGKSDGDKGDRQATATRAMAMAKVTMWAMATATRLAGDDEDNGNGGKSDGDGNKGGGQARVMATNRVMVMATRVAGERRPRQLKGQWQWQQRWWASKRAMATGNDSIDNHTAVGDGSGEGQSSKQTITTIDRSSNSGQWLARIPSEGSNR